MWPFLAWLHSERIPEDVTTLSEGAFLARASPSPPEDAAGWTPRSLPDDWLDHPMGAAEGWYRFHFHLGEAVDAAWGVYLPTLSMNAAAFVNGAPVGDGGRFDEPVARNWNRPLLFVFPAERLVRGENTLHVRLKAERIDAGLLDRVHVGPERALAPLYAWRHGLKVTTVWMIVVAMLAVALFVAALGAQRPSETYYAWFALSVLAWALAQLHPLVVEAPVASIAFDWIWYTGGGWFVLLIVRGVLSFIGEETPRLGRVLVAQGCAGSAMLAALAALDSAWFHPVAALGWATSVYVVSWYSTLRVVAALGRYPDRVEVLGIYLAGFSIVVCGLHDWLVAVGVIGRARGYYGIYTAPGMLLTMAVILTRRFVGALRQSEALVATLEDRVRERRAELERSYERLRAIERTRILSEERERIMRDTQDGLGAQLVSTLALIERPEAARAAVGTAVRSALDDLRLMIDSLDPSDGDLVPFLGQLRARLRPRLEAAGVGVEWRVEDLRSIEDLGRTRCCRSYASSTKRSRASSRVVLPGRSRCARVTARRPRASPGCSWRSLPMARVPARARPCAAVPGRLARGSRLRRRAGRGTVCGSP